MASVTLLSATAEAGKPKKIPTTETFEVRGRGATIKKNQKYRHVTDNQFASKVITAQNNNGGAIVPHPNTTNTSPPTKRVKKK